MVIACFVISSCLLTGCGGKKDSAQSISDDFNQIQPEASSESENMIMQEGEKLEYEVSSYKSGGRITVNADVISDGVANAQVYELEKVTLDDAYLIQLAEKLFDDGKYEIKPPLECCSLEELTEEQKVIEELYNAEERKERVFYYDTYSSLETAKALEEFDAEDEKALADGQVICEVDEMYNYRNVGRIWGKIDGIDFELYYYNDDESEILELHRVGFEPSKNLYKIMNNMDDTDDSASANECNLEDAKNRAEDLIKNMDFGDYVLAAMYSTQGNLVDPEIDQTFYMDGYRLEYVPTVKDVLITYTYRARVTDEYDPNQEAKEYANQPNIQIDIDSTGLLKIRFGSLYEVKESLSDDTSVIPFSKADEMARNSFENETEETCTVNKVSFENVVVRCDNRYVSVPAWVYYIETNSSQVVAFVAVNALDGNVLHFDMAYDQNLWFNKLDEIVAEDILSK